MSVILQRCLCAAAMIVLLLGGVCRTLAIDVMVSHITGEVSLVNPLAVPAPLAGYSIGSASGSLLPGNWLSIADNYDADSGGPIDPDDN